MHITKIELEDIKSHREATFEFQRGTTAITGENGAGKTTIIEAVASDAQSCIRSLPHLQLPRSIRRTASTWKRCPSR